VHGRRGPRHRLPRRVARAGRVRPALVSLTSCSACPPLFAGRVGGRRRPAARRSSQDTGGALARESLAHGPKPRPALRRQLPERRRGPVRFGRMGSWAVPVPVRAGPDAGPALGRAAVGHHCQPECRAWRQLPRVGGGGIRARRVGGRLPRRQGVYRSLVEHWDGVAGPSRGCRGSAARATG
jgi:hypothetical protein